MYSNIYRKIYVAMLSTGIYFKSHKWCMHSTNILQLHWHWNNNYCSSLLKFEHIDGQCITFTLKNLVEVRNSLHCVLFYFFLCWSVKTNDTVLSSINLDTQDLSLLYIFNKSQNSWQYLTKTHEMAWTTCGKKIFCIRRCQLVYKQNWWCRNN